MKSNPLLISVNHQYISKLFDWKGIQYSRIGQLIKAQGYTSYNKLLDINSIFSSNPMGDPVDRCGNIQGPLNFRVIRPWIVPAKNQSLDDVFESRVRYYISQGQKLNLMWSGGADSTSMVVAFLKHCSDISQLRLVYSPFSLYENLEFFNFITKHYPNLETLDFSGDVYISDSFDGITITGHGGDEFTASLDQSFFDYVGADGLQKNWKDFFWQQTNDSELIDFCDEYFVNAQRPINTVLEARWWFYAAVKSQVYGPRDLSFLFGRAGVTQNRFSSFFDCNEFEGYVWNNIDKIIEPGGEYKTYKKFLRQYIYNSYKNIDYLENTSKINSTQFQSYRLKKIELLNLQWIGILEDATVIRTKNLPLLSKQEFSQTYGNNLDYLFNIPK